VTVTFEGGGYSVKCQDVNGWAFLHSLKGKGEAATLSEFLDAVMETLRQQGDPVVACTAERSSAKRLYQRLGFTALGERWNGHEVFVRLPVPTITA